MTRAYSKTFIRDIYRSQLQSSNTNKKHRGFQENNIARNKAIQNGKTETKHSLSTNTDKEKRWLVTKANEESRY